MVFPLSLAFNASAEAATLKDHPDFRFFTTRRQFEAAPQFDLPAKGSCDSTTCNRWVTAEEAAQDDAAYLLSFSAACYMTVRDIATIMKRNVPMALIQSAWGGTRVEAWMSKEAIAHAGPAFSEHVPPGADQNNASALYNAMVAPWDPFSVRAMIWCAQRTLPNPSSQDGHTASALIPDVSRFRYQGEANANELVREKQTPDYYSAGYQAMIAGVPRASLAPADRLSHT